MNRQHIFQYVKRQYDTEPDYPWDDENAVLRHKKNNKWYGVILQVSYEKLGLPDDGVVDVINVKSDPMLIGSLRMREGFHPAYHMNKDKWISIRLDGSVSAEEIERLIDVSFELTGPKKKAKKRGNPYDCTKIL